MLRDTRRAEVAVEFHDALFANQPEEGGAGLSDEQMIDMAVDAGADEDAITGPIADLESEPWVEDTHGGVVQGRYAGTPTVTVDPREGGLHERGGPAREHREGNRRRPRGAVTGSAKLVDIISVK